MTNVACCLSGFLRVTDFSGNRTTVKNRYIQAEIFRVPFGVEGHPTVTVFVQLHSFAPQAVH